MWETILVFMITIGGIYLGFINPTEAGAIGASALFIISTLLKRRLTSGNNLCQPLEMTRITVMVIFLVAGATVFSYFLALSTIPAQASAWIATLAVSRYMMLVIMLALYFMLGCFLDAVSMMVLTLPVIFPVMVALTSTPSGLGLWRFS